MLPQATAFALALGQIVAGGVLVEVVFGYPGIGSVLFAAIRQADWFLIQGAVFCIVVTIGLATLMLDLVYPNSTRASPIRGAEMSVTPKSGVRSRGRWPRAQMPAPARPAWRHVQTDRVGASRAT